MLALAVTALVAALGSVPAAADREVVGQSVRGERIVAHRFGDPDATRKLLVVGSIHGDETEGHRVIEALAGRRASRLEGVGLWLIQTVNPDGVTADTRGNAHAVDLNRNFPHDWKPIPPSSGYYSGPRPASEPETEAMVEFLDELDPEITIYYHQPFGNTPIPCDRRGRRVALRYARLSGLPPDDCYPTPPGAATGFQSHRLRQRAFVVEFGPGALSKREVRRHTRAVLEIAEPG